MAVYFIQAGDNGPIKIGVATDPRRRLINMRTAHPDVLSLLAVMPGDATLESAMHRRFAGQRIRGEWFAPTAELLALTHQHSWQAPIKARRTPQFVGEPTSFREVIKAWPSLEDFASDADANPNTAKQWRTRNKIPDDRWHRIVRAASKRGIRGVTPEVLSALAAKKPRKKPEPKGRAA